MSVLNNANGVVLKIIYSIFVGDEFIFSVSHLEPELLMKKTNELSGELQWGVTDVMPKNKGKRGDANYLCCFSRAHLVF